MDKHIVLDSSVLIHDPQAVHRFEDATLIICGRTIVELHELASGTSELARNAREAAQHVETAMSQSTASTRVKIEHIDSSSADAAPAIDAAVALNAQGLPVTFISRDATARILASSHGLSAQDYAIVRRRDAASAATLVHPTPGDPHAPSVEVPSDPPTTNVSSIESSSTDSGLIDVSEQHAGIAHYAFDKRRFTSLSEVQPGQLLRSTIPQQGEFIGVVTALDERNVTVRVVSRQWESKEIWGVSARNPEQAAALAVLLDTHFDLVTVVGDAGTGKTLIALAAGLKQVFDDERYSEILVTRATVAVGEDIGYLPGTEEEKMNPWMGALDDNLQVLLPNASGGGSKTGWGKSSSYDLIKSRVSIRSLNYMRGRTFLNKYVIIDEAQNLTPHQMKMLVTRAGVGSKIVCLGNMAQIDTPWLSESTSGLGWLRDRFAGWPHGAHVNLTQVERSRLAVHASKVL